MILETRSITKRFDSTYALQDVSVGFHEGEFHALVGENGAGKSTLIKILSGIYVADAGEIIWQGKTVSITNPRQSMELGIRVIHQDRHLVPSFSVVENVYLGREYERKGLRVNWTRMREQVNRLMDDLDIHLPLDIPTRFLSPPQRTQTEILRALMTDSKVLILDEPTAALTDQESVHLFAIIKKLQDRGTTILYVSHRLDEIIALSDRISVLKNGQLVKTFKNENASKEDIISLMTGDWSDNAPQERKTRPKVKVSLLEVNGLTSVDGVLRGVNLQVYAGEILGIFGLGGSGRTETLECIYGSRSIAAGTIFLEGKSYPHPSPERSIQNGIAMIPEDRRGKALIMGLSVKENTVISVIDSYSRWGFMNDHDQERDTVGKISSLSIKTTGPRQPVRELSGGNQQKVAFAKAMMSSPRIILCDEPTQAVDVKTRREIHSLLRAMADQGKAIVFVSSDLKETLEVADRIQVISRGQSKECFENNNLDGEKILGCCYTE